MASENFAAVMEHVFRSEGGYVDHPKDPGGATNFGITIGTLRDYRNAPVTKDDVKNLSKAEAAAIYRARYWDAISGDELPAGLDLCTMDGAVNSGPSRGAKWLQMAIGTSVDGKIGTKTLAAADAAELLTAIDAMCDARLSFLRRLPTWATFGRGWSRRVEEVRAAAREMATAAGADAAAPRVSEPSPPVEVKPGAIAPPAPTPTGGTKSKATGAAIGPALALPLLLLLEKFGLIPAEVAHDPASLLIVGTVVSAGGAWLGAYFAPKNAEAAA